jgi:ABC-type bacteriocin/lantibiotic exporter with double-glycine peptidase domain
MDISPIYQNGDSDCGVACLQMLLNYHKVRRHGSLANAVDGVQIRTIESFLREKGLQVVAGNMTIHLLKYFVARKLPIICLIDGHYVLVKGFEPRKIIYNCPALGELKESLVKFNKKWFNTHDGNCLTSWAIVAF